MKAALLVIAILCSLAVTTHAQTVKLWKWVDKEGKVTYSEDPPPRDAVQVQEKQLESSEGTVQSETPPESITLPTTAAPSPPSSPASTGGTAAGRAARRGAAASESESGDR